jgi:glycosyltransferase involved in cell wall biosynthesis
MRIVNAMLGRAPEGAEQTLVDYCEAAQRSGHEAHAVISPGAGVKPVLSALGVPAHTLPGLGEWAPLASFRLGRLLNRLKPEVCIAHNLRAADLLLRAGGGLCIAGVLQDYKVKYENLRFLLSPTQDLLRQALGKGARDRQGYHIPALVRVPSSEPVRDWHSPPVIGAMGRLVPEAGFDLFIETLAVLKERGLGFRAVLAGEGGDAKRLATLAARREVGDRLQLAGPVERQAFFDSIDIFCLPSGREPVGALLLEAMAQALPVAALGSEGPAEILRDGVDGMLVPVDKPADLAPALMLLLTDTQHAELLSRNAYDTVKRGYDLPVVALKLDLALRSLARL